LLLGGFEKGCVVRAILGLDGVGHVGVGDEGSLINWRLIDLNNLSVCGLV
jgi:hypothetical protein